MKKAPTRKAMCSYDICDLDLTYCYSDDLLYKRNEQEVPDFQPSDGGDFALAKRAGREKRPARIGLLTIFYWIAKYPSIGQLFDPTKYGAALLTKAFRTRKGFCGGAVLDIIEMPKNPTEKDRKKLETEHPADKGLIGKFIEYMGSGQLPGDKSANTPKIGLDFWQNKWNTANANLAAKPKVGKGDKGKQPATPAERIAESFGSDENPFPFMAVEKGINTAKRDIFLGQAPVDLQRLKRAAKRAVSQDTDEAADRMLSLFQTVSCHDISLDVRKLTRVSRHFRPLRILGTTCFWSALTT